MLYIAIATQIIIGAQIIQAAGAGPWIWKKNVANQNVAFTVTLAMSCYPQRGFFYEGS